MTKALGWISDEQLAARLERSVEDVTFVELLYGTRPTGTQVVQALLADMPALRGCHVGR